MKGFQIIIKCEKCGQEAILGNTKGKMSVWNTDEGLVVHCNNCGNKSDDED